MNRCPCAGGEGGGGVVVTALADWEAAFPPSVRFVREAEGETSDESEGLVIVD